MARVERHITADVGRPLMHVIDKCFRCAPPRFRAPAARDRASGNSGWTVSEILLASRRTGAADDGRLASRNTGRDETEAAPRGTVRQGAGPCSIRALALWCVLAIASWLAAGTMLYFGGHIVVAAITRFVR